MLSVSVFLGTWYTFSYKSFLFLEIFLNNEYFLLFAWFFSMEILFVDLFGLMSLLFSYYSFHFQLILLAFQSFPLCPSYIFISVYSFLCLLQCRFNFSLCPPWTLPAPGDSLVIKSEGWSQSLIPPARTWLLFSYLTFGYLILNWVR